MERRIQKLAEKMSYYYYFSAMSRKKLTEDDWDGVGILSRYPLLNPQTFQYGGTQETPDLFDMTTVVTKRNSQRYLLQICQIEKESKLYTIGNTHFTWTPDGQADDYQRKDLQNLFGFLKKTEPLVFSGDFNAPRGREIFSAIAGRYRDNIPAHYQTSLDENLHRCGYLPYVVDGLFSTPEYKVNNVELVFGVSDHAAVRAEIEINDGL
jgi:endonuclease/exonuclease/phosphatase family metal-dependent hydrolase